MTAIMFPSNHTDVRYMIPFYFLLSLLLCHHMLYDKWESSSKNATNIFPNEYSHINSTFFSPNFCQNDNEWMTHHNPPSSLLCNLFNSIFIFEILWFIVSALSLKTVHSDFSSDCIVRIGKNMWHNYRFTHGNMETWKHGKQLYRFWLEFWVRNVFIQISRQNICLFRIMRTMDIKGVKLFHTRGLQSIYMFSCIPIIHLKF